jgi:hypothetical protein
MMIVNTAVVPVNSPRFHKGRFIYRQPGEVGQRQPRPAFKRRAKQRTLRKRRVRGAWPNQTNQYRTPPKAPFTGRSLSRPGIYARSARRSNARLNTGERSPFYTGFDAKN